MADVAARSDGHREELTPFLDGTSLYRRAQEAPRFPVRRAQDWPWLVVVLLVIAVAVVSDVGEALFSVPKVRLFESALCARYYADVDPHGLRTGKLDIPEHMCIPAILLPVPFGYLADQLGRRWVLASALTGSALSYLWILFVVGATNWPTQWVWLSPAFYLCGGGPIVVSNLLTTIVADVVPAESRSTVFFYRFCTYFAANLAIPPVASFLMSRNIWIPLLGGPLFQVVSVIMVLAIPESAPASVTKEHEMDDQDISNDLVAHGDGLGSFARRRYKIWLREAKSSIGFVLHDKAVAAFIWTFLLFEVGLQSKQVLFQYASKRYGWTLAQAALLPSLRSAITLVLFTVILPGITKLVSPYISRPAMKDLLLSKGSIILLMLGTMVFSISSTSALMILGLIIFSLGSGFEPAARSTVTALVDSNRNLSRDRIGSLYAVISVVEGVGRILSALVMSLALRTGFHLGVPWYGLPFAIASVLSGAAAIILFKIHTRHLALSSDVR